MFHHYFQSFSCFNIGNVGRSSFPNVSISTNSSMVTVGVEPLPLSPMLINFNRSPVQSISQCDSIGRRVHASRTGSGPGVLSIPLKSGYQSMYSTVQGYCTSYDNQNSKI